MLVKDFIAKFQQYPDARIVRPAPDHSYLDPTAEKTTGRDGPYGLDEDHNGALDKREKRIDIIVIH